MQPHSGHSCLGDSWYFSLNACVLASVSPLLLLTAGFCFINQEFPKASWPFSASLLPCARRGGTERWGLTPDGRHRRAKPQRKPFSAWKPVTSPCPPAAHTRAPRWAPQVPGRSKRGAAREVTFHFLILLDFSRPHASLSLYVCNFFHNEYRKSLFSKFEWVNLTQ